MPVAPVDGIEIHYESAGQGTPVMLVAGFGGVGGYWTAQMEPFAARFMPIAMDHRGHGKSTRETSGDYSVERMADDIIRLMDHLQIDKAHYVGHSLGGLIGQDIGLRYPDRFHDLVIYGSSTHSDSWLSRVMEMRIALLESAGPRAFIRATPLFIYPSWWIRDNEDVLAQSEDAACAQFPPVEAVKARAETIAKFDRREQLSGMSLPTLLLCARDDFITPPYQTEDLAKLIPNSEIAFLESGGHVCSQLCADEFNSIVMDFLLRHEPASV